MEVVSAYICFCKDSVIQSKTVKLFANNKPWVTKELKLLLNEKKRVFHSGTKEDRKLVQKKLKHKIRECKKLYKVKVEDMFKANDTKRAWQGLQSMTGYKPKPKRVNVENESVYANDLNAFYCRFDQTDFSSEQTQVADLARSFPTNNLKFQLGKYGNWFAN